MSNSVAGGIHVVSATDGETTHLWAVATPRERAVAAIQPMLDAGWVVTLTNRLLTPDEAASLNLRPGDVRRIDT